MSDVTTDLNIQETVTKIQNLNADTPKKLTETKILGWQTGFAGFTAGAAVIGAVVALMKVLGG